MEKRYLGVDVGSTTIKLAILDENQELLVSKYKRHYSDIEKATKELIEEVSNELKGTTIKVKVTGSGGLGIAKWLNLDFVQEVIACSYAIKRYIPETDVAIELGGEDAKITYFGETIDQRMNGSCAGGTGAFIDQMAVLLDTDATGVNELARTSDKLYPIAARCGVFAKTDIQPLINEGVSKSNIAASIYQAVVNQTISGLAAGKPIVGNVAFLGGPLSFSDQLKHRFIKTLNLSESEVISPNNSMLFVAIGAALHSEETKEINFDDLYRSIKDTNMEVDEETVFLEPLFSEGDETYSKFKSRHSKAMVDREDIATYTGDAFLGIDAGSTTSKLVLISSDKKLLYFDYQNNLGDPLKTIKSMMINMYDAIHDGIKIKYSGSTGYGEALIKSAFKLDLGEIETLCHYKAAAHFNPKVEFILDIGGQDMKCMRIKNGVIYDIMLNEACSSGCGSFIEGFSKTLNVELNEFVKQGVQSTSPVELGSRCTVFMNSKVKQAQKEGASVADISAGLAYSVIKNALVKVIKVNDFSKLGDNIVVQGGTFYNDAVLKAFEKTVGKDAIRPDISGLMGAFGAALVAHSEYDGVTVTNTRDSIDIKGLSYTTKAIRCGACENNCSMTLNTFNDNSRFITGNKCEKGSGVKTNGSTLPNMYRFKYERIFNYTPLPIEKAPRGEVSLPRVLNMYEHYPFWHTFFTSLGFSVKLSPRSNKKVFELGMDGITSDTICYPAKLVHGHVKSLIDSGSKFIFYPCLPFESKVRNQAERNHNCPVVTSYPEVIQNNTTLDGVIYKAPFLPMDNMKVMRERLSEELAEFNISNSEMSRAIKDAERELAKCKQDVRDEGERVVSYMKKHNKKGIVLAGRPYHIDPEINHGLENIITELGMVVLSEDSIAHLAKNEVTLNIMDQWPFHSRAYLAAEYVTTQKNLELLQLTSFGCGIDAITSDQVGDILRSKGKNFSLIKIDEGSNLGAVKIRIRSIYSAMLEREKSNISLPEEKLDYVTPPFTKEMKDKHTILIPQMSPLHFKFIEGAVKQEGYNGVVLPPVDSKAVEMGTKYVNNDVCYPAIIIIGQMLVALKSGKYDTNNTSVIISQTGGGCRASNYIGLLRRALKEAGYGHVPVISFNVASLEHNPGFKVTFKLMRKMVMGAMYGDLLMRVSNRVRPYEVEKGSTDRLIGKWTDIIIDKNIPFNYFNYNKITKGIVEDFSRIPMKKKSIPRVGVVGEIFIKYNPIGNNNLLKTIEDEGAEAVVPDLVDFGLYSAYNNIYNHKKLGRSRKAAKLSKVFINVVDFYRKSSNKHLKKNEWFQEISTIHEKVEALKGIVSVGNQTGEGWFLTADMMEMLGHGVGNIITVQPFGCLPNHIFGKSVGKPIKNHFPKANLMAIDYDPGLSSVNQLNRIKLMLEMSKDNI